MHSVQKHPVFEHSRKFMANLNSVTYVKTEHLSGYFGLI